jgi:hypothetical protein
MTTDKVKTIEDFLYLFGTNMTFSCGLPNNVTGSNKEDSVFSCNGSKSQHIRKTYQGQEMLVVDTPMKIALHKSCKENLIFNLREEGVFLTKCNSEGLCFNTQASANKPTYSAIVKASIKSCYVDELEEHYMHIADFGMKMNIDPGSKKCSLRNFFNKISVMRN